MAYRARGVAVFSRIHLKNFAAFSDFSWSDHGAINVIVGENDTGKSHLLKVMYVMARCADEFSRAASPSESKWQLIVAEKKDVTFQLDAGHQGLIRHGARNASVEVVLAGQAISFTKPNRKPMPSGFNALFIPPKEILTTFSAIAATREVLEIYGFDDTYYDLIKLLRVPPTKGKIDKRLTAVLDDLGTLFQGQIVKSQSSDKFTFQRGDRSFEMPQTADGIKKIGILTTLIKNRSLTPKSVLFLDEPETNLHPKAISLFTKMLFQIAAAGAQVYLATHSYFVIKQLQILAKKHKVSVPFCSLSRRLDGEIDAKISDLRKGMPDNPIVEESIRLYEEEIEVDLGKSKRK